MGIDIAVYGFVTSKLAWTFYRAFEGTGISAGFPSLRPEIGGLYTVRVSIPTWIAREAADALANGAAGHCVGYSFGAAVARCEAETTEIAVDVAALFAGAQ